MNAFVYTRYVFAKSLAPVIDVVLLTAYSFLMMDLVDFEYEIK